jgi:hypothetical protein
LVTVKPVNEEKVALRFTDRRHGGVRRLAGEHIEFRSVHRLEVLDVGDAVSSLEPGQLVSVPFQISCGECAPCLQRRTSNCAGVAFMSSYGFGPAVERWGGFLSDVVCVPYAEHMLVPVPPGLEPAAVASASDNISDAWRAVGPPLAVCACELEAGSLAWWDCATRTVTCASIPIEVRR